jgi:hypothetical protein
MSMVDSTIRLTFTPLACAAVAEMPVARRSNPNLVREIRK